MESLTPYLFHIDYGRLLETLITIVVFSFFIERALAIVFESRIFIDWSEERTETEVIRKDAAGIEKTETIPARPKKKSVRELISVIVSTGFCFWINFDAITLILQSGNKMTVGGTVLTGMIIAGGSKASIAFFHNLMGVMSSAEKLRKDNTDKKP
jgi:hypothetical protein